MPSVIIFYEFSYSALLRM